jgi:hypothetical protein
MGVARSPRYLRTDSCQGLTTAAAGGGRGSGSAVGIVAGTSAGLDVAQPLAGAARTHLPKLNSAAASCVFARGAAALRAAPPPNVRTFTPSSGVGERGPSPFVVRRSANPNCSPAQSTQKSSRTGARE